MEEQEVGITKNAFGTRYLSSPVLGGEVGSTR